MVVGLLAGLRGRSCGSGHALPQEPPSTCLGRGPRRRRDRDRMAGSGAAPRPRQEWLHRGCVPAPGRSPATVSKRWRRHSPSFRPRPMTTSANSAGAIPPRRGPPDWHPRRHRPQRRRRSRLRDHAPGRGRRARDGDRSGLHRRGEPCPGRTQRRPVPEPLEEQRLSEGHGADVTRVHALVSAHSPAQEAPRPPSGGPPLPGKASASTVHTGIDPP